MAQKSGPPKGDGSGYELPSDFDEDDLEAVADELADELELAQEDDEEEEGSSGEDSGEESGPPKKEGGKKGPPPSGAEYSGEDEE